MGVDEHVSECVSLIYIVNALRYFAKFVNVYFYYHSVVVLIFILILYTCIVQWFCSIV